MPELSSNAQERSRAYDAEMTRLGRKPVQIDVEGADTSWQFEAFGYQVMKRHFGQGRYIDATILCANDRIAIGAIRAANRHALFARETSDLRIAGHDDHSLSQYMTPALTTVAQDTKAIGDTAVRRILERINSERDLKPLRMIQNAALKLRESA